MIRHLVASVGLALALPTVSLALEIQEVTSPGGIRAWLAEDHTIPFTALEIDFTGGAALEAADNLGAAYFLTGMFEEGAGDYSAAEYQKRLQETAADFTFDAYRESISVSARFLTENREESIELLRLALESPRFDQDRLEFVRSQILAIIASRENDSGEIAADTINRLAYGDHPFGRPVEGTVDTVTAMTGEDLEAFRVRALTRGGVTVGAAGDITADELGMLLDGLFGGLPESAPVPVDEPEFLLEGGKTVVDYPSPQSLVVFMHEGILRSDPDFLAAYVMDEILGSLHFLSRLKNEVREKRGLTYGIASFLGAYSNSGTISGQFSTDNRSVSEAVEVVKSVWAQLAVDGVAEDELESVKTYLTGAYPLRFDGNGRIASILAAMQRDGLPASYVDNRNDMINALTVEDINRVAARVLKPDNLHFVIVGQPVAME